MSDEPISYAPCGACGAINRVRLRRADGGAPVCSKCKKALPMHGAVVDLQGANGDPARLSAASGIPVVVDCWAEWCGPCRMFAPVFSQAAQQLEGKAVFAKLDTEVNAQIASRLGIRGIPTLIVYKDGREIARQSGAMPLPTFRQWLGQSAGLSV